MSRNWFWTINRRSRKLGFEVSKWPGESSLNRLIDLVKELSDPLTHSKDYADYSRLILGLSLILDRGDLPTSQLGQDCWVLGQMDGLSGTFLEIGAYHPRQWSNTYLLRKAFGWTGFHIDPSYTSEDIFRKFGLGEYFIRKAVGKTSATGFLVGEGAFAQVVEASQHSQTSSSAYSSPAYTCRNSHSSFSS